MSAPISLLSFSFLPLLLQTTQTTDPLPIFVQVRDFTLRSRRCGSLVLCRWRCLTSRNMLMSLGTWSNLRFIIPMERSGKFFVISRVGSSLPPTVTLCVRRCCPCPHPTLHLFLITLLTDTFLSHPHPFKYTIKPRSEKSTILVGSVEF